MTAAERRPVLDVQGFSLNFSNLPDAPNVVDRVSFLVHAGETLCVVGESGCGKSVTSLALMGLLPARPHVASRARRISRAWICSGCLNANSPTFAATACR